MKVNWNHGVNSDRNPGQAPNLAGTLWHGWLNTAIKEEWKFMPGSIHTAAKHGSTSMSQVSKNSVVVKQPKLCFSYDNLVLLNPGLQESADYVCKVAADIVSR